MTDSADITLRGWFDGTHEKRYAHVPFDVPPGVRALHVRYDYSERIPSDPLLSGGNTLDIGLFDPRGIAPSSPGFRGWSGSQKLEFSVTETWATPPYLAGPISPGQWHVLLGPYKVGPRGCDYQVAITFGEDAGPPPPHATTASAQPAAGLPRAAEPGWLRGDLHCHTLHSDGDSWPADMLARAVERGLDFLGVTDHNQVGHQADYASVGGEHLPIVLPGVEVTTYRGHWNAWGTDCWWEFREPTTEAVSRAMRAAAAAGALVSVNHPKPFGPPWDYPRAAGYHAVEVWNGAWERLNHVALAWWEQQLRTGRRLVALGGSDLHRLRTQDPDPRHARDLGIPTTWALVGEDRTPAGVLDALRAGRVFVSARPSGPQLFLRMDAASESRPHAVRVRTVDARRAALLVISAHGVEHAAQVSSDDWTTRFVVPSEARYLRAQLVDEHGQVLALTNPVYTS
jgi:PHP domain